MIQCDEFESILITKRFTTTDFLTFSRGGEMEYWLKMCQPNVLTKKVPII